MASRADLIMAQLRGQGAQIYKEKPEELKGDVLTDIAAGVTAAATAKEAMTGLENAASRFEDKYLAGKFEGEGLIDRVGTGIAERAYGKMTQEQKNQRLLEKGKKEFYKYIEDMPGLTRVGKENFLNTLTGEEVDINYLSQSIVGIAGTNIELDNNGNTIKTNFGQKTPAGM
jgi:hypothetical protein